MKAGVGAGAGGGFVGLDPDDLPDGLVVADEAGRVVCFNSAATRLTGTPADEVLGKHVVVALPLTDTDGRRWWDEMDPYGGLAIRTGVPERALHLPGGREVLVTVRYVRDRPGGPLSRLVIALRGTAARVRAERNHADLIATCAHELRSPLTSVKGFTATLLAKWTRFTDDQKRLMLETVDADADRVTRLIAELLDISRIDSGRLELHRQVVDVAGAVHGYVAGMVAAGFPEDRFVVRQAGGLPEMWLDADKFGQIAGNLLENAVRHGDGTVTIGLESEGDGIAITIDDEGAGIPEEMVDRVFTRFWRGSRRGGTGLGLYIVKGLVEAHGGTITVGRSPTGGARFRVVLPTGTPDFMS